MDSKIFNELVNRGVITHVGLKAENFNSLDDLIKLGVVSMPVADDVYEEIVKELGTYIMTVEELISGIENGGSFTLGDNIVLADYLNVKSDVTIDLNGYSISSATDIFNVSAKLTINGEGKIMAATDNTCSWCAVFAHDNAEVVINGGEYSIGAPDGDYNDLIYARDNAKITINGGTYHSDGTVRNDGTAFVLNLKDNTAAKITVNGGKFENFNPAEANTEPGGPYNFLADGYVSVEDGDWFVVKEA